MSSCVKCGEVHDRCTAHTLREDLQVQCRKFPVRGAQVCATHGGRAPQVKAAAIVRLAQAEVLARFPRRSAVEILMEALHVADAEARPATEAGAAEAALLQERAALLAKTVIDKFGADFEAKMSSEQLNDLIRVQKAIFANVQRGLVKVLAKHGEALHLLEKEWPHLTRKATVDEFRALYEREAGGRS